VSVGMIWVKGDPAKGGPRRPARRGTGGPLAHGGKSRTKETLSSSEKEPKHNCCGGWIFEGGPPDSHQRLGQKKSLV